MKILLIELPSLSLSSKEIDLTELVIARDVLEISALVSVRKKDLFGFERDFLNLQRYYIDYESVSFQNFPNYYHLFLFNFSYRYLQNPKTKI
ncbi:unnamed protein product [Cryptosporidium hominis]|uniref:Uncharacterized protein n=2 Tax=Cryptosporidium hominis TaxID=237895 RepID=A0A0S4TD74_CRYHO|nr:unnamed protein product [Cryptosporidium hominis]